jgi:predicted nuclease of restriction endonuclease-like (RecB) superfamily
MEKGETKELVRAIGSEINQSQVKLISAANRQMLLHYWKLGQFIVYNQKQLGWGGKFIEKLSKAIREAYPEKKGYSPRNLKYMCQFAKRYPLEVIQELLIADEAMSNPTIRKVMKVSKRLNEIGIGQEALAQIEGGGIGQEALAQIEGRGIGQEALAQTEVVENEGDRRGKEGGAQMGRGEIGQEALAQIEVGRKKRVRRKKIQDVPTVLRQITQQPVAQIEEWFLNSALAQINWASHVILLNSQLPLGTSYWYMKQTVECGWSSPILDMQIENGLFQRQIEKKQANNFKATLPPPQSDLANYLLKDPYIFDLAGMQAQANERDIEKQLVSYVTKYLMEMGNTFAFVAQQKHFQVGGSDFYADLILYNIKLHAYVVVELKATPFKPEYAGQLNFYVNVVNDTMKEEDDNNTVGLLLCRGKDEIMVQYALEGYNQPLGVSDYQLSRSIPEPLKSALPTIEEVEQGLTQLLAEKERS